LKKNIRIIITTNTLEKEEIGGMSGGGAYGPVMMITEGGSNQLDAVKAHMN
jgi:hypothetical protein